jgi:nucleoside-diphosphate-sugar epimerase
MVDSVLVVGASGLIGNAVVDQFLAEGRQVVAMSRRPPETSIPGDLTHLAVDLFDAGAVRDAVATSLGSITHVVYTAVYEKPGLVAGWSDPEQMATNLAMIRNVLDPLAELGNLEHVSLLQGTKAYGVHLHPIPIPARERYPRDAHENFYWLQEDYVVELAQRHGFSWTIFRPTVVLGYNYGVAMNVLPVVGAFAAIAQETGTPFGFPGHMPYVREAVDVRLIAEAATWAASAANARDQHFNLTNGEVFSWRDLWPQMAEQLGVEAAPDSPLSMGGFLPAHDHTWDRIVARHNLRPTALPQVLGESHHYADFCFGYGLEKTPPPAFVSTVKIKEAGFNRVFDTSACVNHWLSVLIERRVIPGPTSGRA